MKIMGMGKLADDNEESGQGVVMQAPNRQKTDIEQLGNGWFMQDPKNQNCIFAP